MYVYIAISVVVYWVDISTYSMSHIVRKIHLCIHTYMCHILWGHTMIMNHTGSCVFSVTVDWVDISVCVTHCEVDIFVSGPHTLCHTDTHTVHTNTHTVSHRRTQCVTQRGNAAKCEL